MILCILQGFSSELGSWFLERVTLVLRPFHVILSTSSFNSRGFRRRPKAIATRSSCSGIILPCQLRSQIDSHVRTQLSERRVSLPLPYVTCPGPKPNPRPGPRGFMQVGFERQRQPNPPNVLLYFMCRPLRGVAPDLHQMDRRISRVQDNLNL